MKRRPLPILLNTKAGALKFSPSKRQIENVARRLGLEVEVLPFFSTQALRRKVKELVEAKTPKIAVAGGDGTVAAAVQELVHSQTVLGILPQGTANNFASALRIPQDLPSALKILRDGRARAVSVGKVGDRYFTESAGIGLFADILAIYGAGTNKNLPRAIYALIRTLFSIQSNSISIEIDGKKKREKVTMCTVHNCYRMASALPMAPDAKLTDDVLNVVVIGKQSLKELVSTYRAIRAQVHIELPQVSTVEASEVRISCRNRLNVHCDDEVVGTTPVTIRVEPRSLRVLVDRL